MTFRPRTNEDLEFADVESVLFCTSKCVRICYGQTFWPGAFHWTIFKWQRTGLTCITNAEICSLGAASLNCHCILAFWHCMVTVVLTPLYSSSTVVGKSKSVRLWIGLRAVTCVTPGSGFVACSSFSPANPEVTRDHLQASDYMACFQQTPTTILTLQNSPLNVPSGPNHLGINKSP